MQFGQPIIAKPAKGLRVRKEDGTWLSEAGDTVTHSSYWARREKDGDVTLSELPKPKKSA
ncbi:MAG: DUF2635 domain-containing protein [Pseudomonadota bacterium]